MNKLIRPLVLALIVGGAGATTPAHALIPVTDYAHIIQSILNVMEQIKEWTSYLNTFNQYRSLYQAASHGNYSMMPWTELLDLADAPWFDGVDGIDDIRQLCTVTSMSVADLQALYHEYEVFTRMSNDPLYAKSRAFAAYQSLTQGVHTRMMRRKIVIARMMQRHQTEMKKLTDQAKACRDEISRESALGTPEASVIAALQGKLAAIQAKMEAGKQGLADQLQLLRDQETNELAEARSKVMMEVWDQRDLTADDRRKYWAAAFGGGR